jgi:protein-disulfide isomerase
MAFVFTEFPHLSHHYNVGAVPKIVINDKVQFEGALPEKQYLDKLIEATNKV